MPPPLSSNQRDAIMRTRMPNLFMSAVVLLLAYTAAPTVSFADVAEHSEECVAASEQDIAALFIRWNESLKTGDPFKVVEHYAAKSVLLPTVSSIPRFTVDEKADYFREFQRNEPDGQIESRVIELDCNTAIDEGLYTFTFKKTGAVVKARYTLTYKWDGNRWLITSHHSSRLPAEQIPPEEPVHSVARHSEVCVAATEREIEALLDRWKEALQSGNPHKVITHYAARSVLLPLSSMKPRLTLDDKEDYFRHFLKNKPVIQVDSHMIEIDCNTAINDGLYTYTFKKTGDSIKARYTFTYKWDGMQWLITSDHSSIYPQ